MKTLQPGYSEVKHNGITLLVQRKVNAEVHTVIDDVDGTLYTVALWQFRSVRTHWIARVFRDGKSIEWVHEDSRATAFAAAMVRITRDMIASR